MEAAAAALKLACAASRAGRVAAHADSGSGETAPQAPAGGRGCSCCRRASTPAAETSAAGVDALLQQLQPRPPAGACGAVSPLPLSAWAATLPALLAAHASFNAAAAASIDSLRQSQPTGYS